MQGLFAWYDLPAMLVYAAQWHGVGLLMAGAAIFFTMARRGARRDRASSSIAFLFLVLEAALLSYVYQQHNAPPWYDPLFYFNGFALPFQLVCALGVVCSSGLARSRWLVLSGIPGITAVPFLPQSAGVFLQAGGRV